MPQTEPASPRLDSLSDEQLRLVAGGAGSVGPGGSQDTAIRNLAAGTDAGIDIHALMRAFEDQEITMRADQRATRLHDTVTDLQSAARMLGTLADEARARDWNDTFSEGDLQTALDTLKNKADAASVGRPMNIEIE